MSNILYPTVALFISMAPCIAMELKLPQEKIAVGQGLVYLQKMSCTQELQVSENNSGLIKDGFEHLDTSKIEPILNCSFKARMSQKALFGVPFILAIAKLMAPSNNLSTDSEATLQAYYEATGINNTLFGDIELSGKDWQYHYNKNRLTMTQDQLRDPYTKLYITGIEYFVIKPNAQIAEFLATDMDLFVNSPTRKFLVELLLTHIHIDYELAEMDRDPHYSSPAINSYICDIGALHQQQHYPEAKEYFKLAAHKNNGLDAIPRAIYYLAGLCHEQKEYPEACIYYKRAITETHDLDEKTTALNGLAYLYKDQKKFAKAIKYFKQVADQDEKLEQKAEACNQLSLLYYELNKIAEAIYWAMQAAEQNDGTQKAIAYFNLGFLQQEQKKYLEAITYYRKAAEQHDDLGLKQKAQDKLMELQEYVPTSQSKKNLFCINRPNSAPVNQLNSVVGPHQ